MVEQRIGFEVRNALNSFNPVVQRLQIDIIILLNHIAHNYSNLKTMNQ